MAVTLKHDILKNMKNSVYYLTRVDFGLKFLCQILKKVLDNAKKMSYNAKCIAVLACEGKFLDVCGVNFTMRTDA